MSDREAFWEAVAKRLGVYGLTEDLYLAGDVEFAAEQLGLFLEADADGRRDILAFHGCGGPAKVRKAKEDA